MSPVPRAGLTAAVLLAAAAARPALAQAPPQAAAPTPEQAPAPRPSRSGLWIENGAGPGAIRVGCSTCPDVTKRSGSASYLRAGAALSPTVLAGLEVFAFADELFAFDPDDDETVEAENASIAAIVMWYPVRRFFVKGGVGLARGTYRFASNGGEVVKATGNGSGMTLGVGVDLPVHRWIALTANAGAYVSAIGDVVLPTRVVDDVIATMYHATIAITIR